MLIKEDAGWGMGVGGVREAMRSDLENGELGREILSTERGWHEGMPLSSGGAIQVAEVVEDVQACHHSSLDLLLSRKFSGTVPRRRPSSTLWSLVLLFGDTLLILALLVLLLVSAPSLQLGLRVSSEQFGDWNAKLIWGCLALISWGIGLSLARAQELPHAASRLWGPLRMWGALALMVIFWMGCTYPFSDNRTKVYAVLLLRFIVLAAPLSALWRLSFAEFLNLPRFRPRAVIVGANAAREGIAREIYAVDRPLLNVVGYISESEGGGEGDAPRDDLPRLGDKEMLRYLARQGLVDIIIMAIDHRSNSELFAVALETMQYGISIVPLAVMYERISGKVPVEHIGDQWYVALGSERHVSLPYLFWNKTIDLISGLSGLIVLLLVLPIIAPLIYLDSPGPLFYMQERIGYRGKIFRMVKFRSMRTDAEEPGRPIWATQNDERVTRVGRFLRATHLDELPQVINILRGEMSLVGPRPEREAFVVDLEQSIPFYRCRLSAKPGLTGWAQVKYPYGSTHRAALEKLQYDLYYIKHRSCALDVFIMIKTAAEMLLCRGR
jgi:exopolysaccharide biosynthesis polyprenyl glycosylphosphotransferase